MVPSTNLTCVLNTSYCLRNDFQAPKPTTSSRQTPPTSAPQHSTLRDEETRKTPQDTDGESLDSPEFNATTRFQTTSLFAKMTAFPVSPATCSSTKPTNQTLKPAKRYRHRYYTSYTHKHLSDHFATQTRLFASSPIRIPPNTVFQKILLEQLSMRKRPTQKTKRKSDRYNTSTNKGARQRAEANQREIRRARNRAFIFLALQGYGGTAHVTTNTFPHVFSA